MVVNDVENHFDAGGMEISHHRLELANLIPRRGRRGVTVLRRKKAQRVVPPIVGESFIQENPVVRVMVDGQKFHSGDAQRLEMLDRGRRCVIVDSGDISAARDDSAAREDTAARDVRYGATREGQIRESKRDDDVVDETVVDRRPIVEEVVVRRRAVDDEGESRR